MQIVYLVQHWWAQQTWEELIGVISGLLCVYLAAANSILNWPIAIISTGLYVYIFAISALYADMLQYIFLCVTCAYGWYKWTRHPNSQDNSQVLSITKKQVAISTIIIIVATPLLGFTLINFAAKLHYNPPAFPYIDSFLTSCSFVAQILLARKIIENWFVWIFVDIFYIVIYFKKNLVATSIMFFILIIVAIYGYIDWKKSFNKQQETNL